ncbi:MAG: folate-binding protein YgfZ [Pseudomonadales bacterium]|nr:folate-binding protein YgfZ [Pseudomonadales bacterium]
MTVDTTTLWTCQASDYPHFEHEPYTAHASHWGIIELKGPDAAKFLQGQCTADTSQLHPDHALPAATLNLKGRVLELFLIIDLGSSLFLIMPSDLMTEFMQRMQRYLAFSQTTQRDVSSSWSCWIDGRKEGPGPERWSCRSSTQEIEVRLSEHRSLRILSGDHPDLVHRSVHALPSAFCILGDIRDGLPVIFPATRDLFLPQMLHGQALGSLSFSKGCYTGQEVVARTWFRGQIKQSMYRLTGIHEYPVLPAQTVYHQDEQGQMHAAGHTVIAVQGPEQHIELLAVIREEWADQQLLLQPQGHFLKKNPLPYAIPVRENRPPQHG